MVKTLGLVSRVLCLASLAAVLGCGRERTASPGPGPSVTLTNVVEVVREVVVTNVVNVAVTNVVVERREGERSLSPRKTAPYRVAVRGFDAVQLRKLASDSAVRVIECSNGAVALVEASDKSVGLLRGVADVTALEPSDKIAPDSGECVRVLPLSLIDLENVERAVRSLGGEVLGTVTRGRPAVRAKLSLQSIRTLAGRGDVRRIERDEQ